MNDGGTKKDGEQSNSDPAPDNGTKLAKSDSAGMISPEVIQSTRSRLDPNIVLIKVTQRADPAHMVEATKAMLDVFYEDEKRSLEIYKARTTAVIESKERDPDEIEKRKSNGTRRILKLFVAGMSLMSLAGGLISVVTGGNLVITGLMLTIGGVGLALLVPLASGESVTSADVVRVINAMKPQLASDNPTRDNENRQKGKGKKR